MTNKKNVYQKWNGQKMVKSLTEKYNRQVYYKLC